MRHGARTGVVSVYFWSDLWCVTFSEGPVIWKLVEYDQVWPTSCCKALCINLIYKRKKKYIMNPSCECCKYQGYLPQSRFPENVVLDSWFCRWFGLVHRPQLRGLWRGCILQSVSL